MDIEKKLQLLGERLRYIQDIFGHRKNEHIELLKTKLDEFLKREPMLSHPDKVRELASLEDLFTFQENRLERELIPMDRVRIVRHPQRICLKDILENVYDNYTEIGGQDEYSIDPSMLIARAYITRRVRGRVQHQPVMVIGQEKGHGQEFRNGGSVKPWGNAKALHYMKVAETENIPIHTYVFTPGSFPVEDYPGAAQQIAKNLYEMAALKVPVIAVFSEGGSGGAEAIGLADKRLMLSHGYYSVISPEGAAAIESGIRQGQRAPVEYIENAARNLKITAEDNKRLGYIDRIVPEPPLGARPEHYDFFKLLRQEVISATDEVVLKVRGIKLFRAWALRRRKRMQTTRTDAENFYVRWSLSSNAREDLLVRRYQRFAQMSRKAFLDLRPTWKRAHSSAYDLLWSVYSFFRYDLFRKHSKKVRNTVEEVGAEVQYVWDRVLSPVKKIKSVFSKPKALPPEKEQQLTQLSYWEDENGSQSGAWKYVSPKAREDRAVSCPNAATHGCLDLWAPDLFGDFAGVCSYCGHHFRMEYHWYLYNVFDANSIYEFNEEIESQNPLDYEGFSAKLEQAKKKTGLKSACKTFEARIDGIQLVVAMLAADFRGGTVGAAEGEKFFRAAERARKKHFPFLAYVHGTAGIRIQEGVNGVIQMPRCTLAVRRYIDAGGLYLVLYDTNSYAGPVASFLGCSPYQFSIRSANIGFAGPGVIKETTGMDIPPDYHKAYSALSRGHIQGIWDRREVRGNLQQALLTMGGRNLYYR
ncbi:MAG: carboxyl transferase domain-containing protein [Oceanidesulfovibrio sp.]